jgi:hypothetical protein
MLLFSPGVSSLVLTGTSWSVEAFATGTVVAAVRLPVRPLAGDNFFFVGIPMLHKTHGFTGTLRATGSANAVNVIFSCGRYIEVDHVIYIVNVQSPTC